MKSLSLFTLGTLLLGGLLTGCAAESNDTTIATQEIEAASSKGGNLPSPNLVEPVGGGGARSSDSPARTGKFRNASPGG